MKMLLIAVTLMITSTTVFSSDKNCNVHLSIDKLTAEAHRKSIIKAISKIISKGYRIDSEENSDYGLVIRITSATIPSGYAYDVDVFFKDKIRGTHTAEMDLIELGGLKMPEALVTKRVLKSMRPIPNCKE